MKRELRKELGEAVYNARKEMMLTGAYMEKILNLGK